MAYCKGMDVKLAVKPVFLAFIHEYVYEGPCRFNKLEDLTKEAETKVSEEQFAAFENDLTEAMPREVALLDALYIKRSDDFRIPGKIMERIAEGVEHIDLYIFGFFGRSGDIVIEFAEKFKKPVAVMQFICGTTYTTAALRAKGLEAYAYRTWREAARHMKVLRVKKVLQNTAVLLATRLNSNISFSALDSFVSLEQVTAKLGTQFRYTDMHEFLDQTCFVPPDSNPTLPGRRALNPTVEEKEEMEEMADNFMAGAKDCHMDRDRVVNSFRPYFTVKKLLDYYECNAFAAPCPDMCATRRLNREEFTLCLTHSLLNEEGYCSACEYDVSALLSMVVLANLANKAPYMGNTNPIVFEDGRMRKVHPALFPGLKDGPTPEIAGKENVMVTSHAVPNRKMAGFDGEPASYGIRSFAHSGWGATIRYDFNRDIGKVITMMRFDPKCEKIFVAKGTVLGGLGYDNENCTEGVFFQVKDQEDFFQKQCDFGLHLPLVYGDYLHEVSALGKVLGLGVVTA